MSFFYDLNKKLDAIRETPSKTHGQLNERDEGKPGKNFAKIAKDAGERYGSKAAGERVAGAVRNKLRDQGKLEEAGQDFGPGTAGPKRNQAGPAYSFSPDTKNYKTPNLDRSYELDRDPHIAAWNKEKVNTTMGPDTRGNQAHLGAYRSDALGQTKYVDRTEPTMMNKIKDKMGWDKPDPAYGPRPDERERLAKRYPKPTQESGGPAPAKSMVDKQVSTAGRTPPYVPAKDSKPATKDNGMGRIVQGTWQADPKGKVPAPSGDPEGVPESSAPMTAKQKSFAKLAPPANKITFADKIAGAKKEVDEMLGDVAAEAMRNALSPKQKKIDMNKNGKLDANDFAMLRKGAKKNHSGEMDEANAFDYKSPRDAAPKAGSIEHGHKHDIKHSTSDPKYTGRTVTRRTDAQGISVGTDDDTDAQQGPRGRGRPKGTKNVSSKAKVFQRKSKLMTKEGDQDITDQGEYDQEGDMAKGDIKTIVRHAQALYKILGDNDNLPEWVQSKLAKVESMMVAVDEYMQNQDSDGGEEPIAEKAVSKKQQRFMGMAHAMQKGEKIPGASKELKKVAKTMKPKDTEDFASTKHKGLPEKVKSKKKEEVEEDSDEGRLKTSVNPNGTSSTSSTTGRINATLDKGQVTVKPAKTNSMVGKGIYDSMNRELELMISESMSVNMSDSTEGNKSLTVTATDDDAMKLAMILKSAGLGGSGSDMHSHEEPCPTCGMEDCGCGDVEQAIDENAPDWPTNTEQADNNFGYAGGLNKPKADVAGNGQSTVPVVATHPHNDDLRRIREMAGIKTEVDLGPTSPEVARMSKDEVNAALTLGMSPDVTAMSNDEVNAAFKSGMSPDTSDMNPDSVNAEFGKDDNQYEDSIQRMKEMAGIKEAKQADKDYDGDGKIESGKDEHAGSVDKAIKKAQAEKKVDESIFALTNQWRAYKG